MAAAVERQGVGEHDRLGPMTCGGLCHLGHRHVARPCRDNRIEFGTCTGYDVGRCQEGQHQPWLHRLLSC